MRTPEEIFEYIKDATDSVYNDPQFAHGWSTDEERQALYLALRDALFSADAEDDFIGDIDKETFANTYELMEWENFHGENAAFCALMASKGFEHTIINMERDYLPYLYK